MNIKQSVELIREGRFLAEVPVELIEDDAEWSPYLSPAEIEKLDTVRLALRRGDLAKALGLAKIYEIKLVETAPQAAE